MRYRNLILLAVATVAAQLNFAYEVGIERLDSDDATISLLALQERYETESTSHTLSLSLSHYSVDFEPATFDLFGESIHLSEEATVVSWQAETSLSESLWIQYGAAYRDGFADFRSLWLDTYFDQHFSDLPGVPGADLYDDFSPKAISANAGIRWEYLPASGIAQVSVTQIQDEVSPGYEIDFDGVFRSDLVLATTSIRLSTENVITPRIRTRAVLGASQTSQRSWRYSAEFAINQAIGERWIWRNRVGGSTEDPNFDAYFLDTAIEYEVSEKLALYLDARTYSDSGEIEDALLFTSASPELDNDAFGLGLRYRTEKWNSRLYLSYSSSEYAPTNANTDFFQNLYRDRDWTSVQFVIGRPL